MTTSVQTSSNGNSNSAVVTSPAIVGDSLDDLIPPELKQALEKNIKEDESKAVSEDKRTDSVVNDVVSKDNQSTTAKVNSKEDSTTDDEDFDLSPESISRLLDGDLEAVSKVKKTTSDDQGDEEFPWEKDEEFSKLVPRLKLSGVDKKELNTLIRKINDSSVIENKTYVSKLQEELNKYKTKEEGVNSELDRLRQIERASIYDSLEEVKQKYKDPMYNAAVEMKKIIDMQGANINLGRLLAAPNRVEFDKLTADFNLDSDESSRLTGFWKKYKELEMEYSVDKESAKKDLQKHLSFNIPETVSNKILHNSFQDILKDEKYKYIQQAVMDDISKHEDVSKILTSYKTNFINFVQALSNPAEYNRNPEWLGGLAKFMINAAHNKHRETVSYQLEKDLGNHKELLKTVVAAYKKLASSAKGINNGRGTTMMTNSNGKGRSDNKEIVEKFDKFLKSGSFNIDDLLD